MKFKKHNYKKYIFIITVFVIISIQAVPLINNTSSLTALGGDFNPEMAQIETVALKPDGDIEEEWNYVVTADHFEYVNDDPDNPDGLHIIECQVSGRYESYNFETTNIAGGRITQIRVRIRFINLGTGTPLVNLIFNGDQGSLDLIPDFDNAHDYIWTELNGDQADLDGLQVRFTSSLNGFVKSNVLFAVEVYASYEPSSTLSYISRPIGDAAIQWLPAVPTHYDMLDEVVIDPQPGDSAFIVASSYDSGVIDEFIMDGNVQDVGQVTEIQVKTYGYFVGTLRPRVSIYWNGIWQLYKNVYLPGGLYPYPPPGIGWATNTWTLEGDQNDVDNLRVRYKARVQNVPYASNLISAFYCNILYESGINIEINSPQGLYMNPMDGYYPGTFGFEDEVVFGDISSYPTTEIISEIDGHNKVLKLTSDANWRSISDTISDQESGTIEWWVKTPISYVSHRLILYDGATQGLIIYFHNDGMIYEHDGSTAPFAPYTANIWMHVRVDFDCNTDTYYVYIDGVRYGPYQFINIVSAIDKVFFDTGGASNTRYIDAIGYSWDQNYNIGDNHKKGLLLDFEPDNLEQMNYILDNNNPVYISGDTVIPFPFTRDHTIKVRGKYGGEDVESETIEFNFGSTDPEDENYIERIAMLFYYNDREGSYLDGYEQILEDKGFTTIIRDVDVNMLDFVNHINLVDEMEDGNDIIFLYMAGHGDELMFPYLPPHSEIILHPQDAISSDDARTVMDWLESPRKMVLVDSCYSEGFVYDFDGASYISMSSSSYDKKSWGTFGQGYFSRAFMSEGVFYGENSYQAFFRAASNDDVLYHDQQPQFTDRSDIHFFGY